MTHLNILHRTERHATWDELVRRILLGLCTEDVRDPTKQFDNALDSTFER
jgi:hypothetical protein